MSVVSFTAVSADLAPGSQIRPDCVLVDDDSLVHMTWTVSAAESDKKLMLFSQVEELFKALPHIDRTTPIYLDSNLGGGIRGEDIAIALRSEGFGEIFIATGYSHDSLSALPDGVRVVGKEPPWQK